MMNDSQNNSCGNLEKTQNELDFLNDERILLLIKELGTSGFGMYCILKNHIQVHSQNGLPLEYLVRFGKKYFAHRKVRWVLVNFNLFNIDKYHLVTVNDTSRTCTPVPVARNTPDNLNINQENIKTKSIGCMGEIAKLEEEAKTHRFKKPTVEEVAEYCSQRGNTVNPDRFFNFYESKGWKIGKNSMKDWKAAVRTWEQEETRSMKAEPASPAAQASQASQATPSSQASQPSDSNSFAIYDENGVQYFHGRPLPPDAPPRPSEKAEWDDATNSWTEFYS